MAEDLNIDSTYNLTRIESPNLDLNSEERQTQGPKLTWRQMLNKEFSKIMSNDTQVENLNEREINHNKKLVKHAIHSFISLVIPLTMTFLLVLLIMNNLPFFKDKTYIFAFYTPIEEKESDSNTVKFGNAFINSMIFLAIVVVQTVILYLLYKYKCYRVIYGFLYTSIFLTLAVLSLTVFTQVLVYFNLSLDYITATFIIVNYSAVGMAAIFTNLSPLLQRIYHVISSAFVGCIFIRVFPVWTGWVVLGFLVIWDLIAVLTPFGPLRLLVETATSREESLFPALIFKTMLEPSELIEGQILYSSSNYASPSTPNENIQFIGQDLNNNSDRSSLQPQQQNAEGGHSENEEDEYEGSQLGLGDFVFFGILIGKSVLFGDMNVVFVTYVALIFGFFVTYLILISLGKALPALPVSLVIGLLLIFSTEFFLSPFFSYITSRSLIL